MTYLIMTLNERYRGSRFKNPQRLFIYRCPTSESVHRWRCALGLGFSREHENPKNTCTCQSHVCKSCSTDRQKCSTGAGRRCAGRLGRHPSSSALCSSALPAASVTRAVSYDGGTTLEELVAGHGSGSCERWPCACAWRRNGAREVRARCERGDSEVRARCERGASEVRARYGRDATLGIASRRVAQGSAKGRGQRGRG